MSKSTWRIEEARMKVSGKPRHLWKAIDEDGKVLDFCITETGDREAALGILRHLLSGVLSV